MNLPRSYDFVIVGAGVIGLAIARAIRKSGLGTVLVIEKELRLGLHSSGRNSGVLHAGIYYPPNSLKAKFCVRGAEKLRAYILENNISHKKCGKLILPQDKHLDSQIDLLAKRSVQNGVDVEILDTIQIAELEPLAKPVPRALYSPNTWVFDPQAILERFKDDILSLGGEVALEECFVSFDSKSKIVNSSRGKVGCGKLINAAGLWADRIAHSQGVGLDYAILPFRGSYFQLSERISKGIRGLIYPVPDFDLPFLGLHVTRGVHDLVTVGPTATPAFGRENYQWYAKLRLEDTLNIVSLLTSFFINDRHNMRRHMAEEIKLNSKAYFAKNIQRLVPSVKSTDLLPSKKMGLRAQVVRKSDFALCMDFLVEPGRNSIHIINAVSPAFSSSLEFADWVVQKNL